MGEQSGKAGRPIDSSNITKLEPGDIFRCRASGPVAWANSNLTAPKTEWFHHGLLWFPMKLEHGDDWVTIESTSEAIGVGVGLLSWYGSPLCFLRVDAPPDTRHEAPKALIPYGRSKYDFFLFAKLFAGGVRALVKIICTEHRLRKLRAEDFAYAKDDALICTEAVQIAYLAMGFPIIDPEVVPIPAAFEQAIEDGVLKVIGYYEGGKVTLTS